MQETVTSRWVSKPEHVSYEILLFILAYKLG